MQVHVGTDTDSWGMQAARKDCCSAAEGLYMRPLHTRCRLSGLGSPYTTRLTSALALDDDDEEEDEEEEEEGKDTKEQNDEECEMSVLSKSLKPMNIERSGTA